MPNPLSRSNKRRAAEKRAGHSVEEIRRSGARRGKSSRQSIQRHLSNIRNIARRAKDPLMMRELEVVLGNLSRLSKAIDDLRQPRRDTHRLAEAQRQKYAEQIQAESKRAGAIIELMHRATEVQEATPPGRPDDDSPLRGLNPQSVIVSEDGRMVRVRTTGFDRSYKINDPIITRTMIPVDSSNVHSIGFEFNFKKPHRSKLLVRFLGTQPGGERTGKGSLYEYFDIHPDKFVAFRRAASKGEWVWDELRVRGSRVAHQVRYNLRAIVGKYLPRRAAIRNGKEMFIRRKRQTRAKLGENPIDLVSQLPTQVLGAANVRPNSGRPYRGR